METRGRGIKVICHLILWSPGFFINLLTSWGFGAAVEGSRRCRVGFPPPFFLFFKGAYDRVV